ARRSSGYNAIGATSESNSSGGSLVVSWSVVVVVISCDCACCADPVEVNASPMIAITPRIIVQLRDFIIFYFQQLPWNGRSNVADRYMRLSSNRTVGY